MKFRYDHRFEGGPFDKVVLFLTEEYLFEPQKLPNVQSNVKLEETITEDKKHWRYQWCAHGQIPKVVQHIITPKMLTWVEDTTFDRKKKTYFTRIIPHYFQNTFKCESRGWFEKKSDNEFIRVTDGFLSIKIPVFGPFIEEAILAHLKINFTQEYNATFKVVKEKFGKK